MRPDRGSRRRVLIGILIAVMLIALFGAVVYLIEKHGLLDEQFGDSGDWGSEEVEQYSLELNDREYVSSDDIDAFLVIGKDDPKEGETGYNGEMADFLMLVLMDNTTEKYAFYQIDRDTPAVLTAATPGTWSVLVPDLKPGTYTITETDSGNLVLR